MYVRRVSVTQNSVTNYNLSIGSWLIDYT